VASWPRTIIPFEVSALDMPGPLISKAQSGRVNIRTTQQIGRTWTEHYLVNVRSVNGRALLATIDNYWRNGTIFTIDHRDHITPLGAGGGSPLVNSNQLMTEPQNFGAWSPLGTPVLTAGQADPVGGTAAYLINDDSAAAFEYLRSPIITYTGNAEKAVAFYEKQGTQANSWVRLNDTTAGVQRHQILITWTAGEPSMATTSGSGTLFPVEAVAGFAGWYRLSFTANGVIAANNNAVELGPGGLSAAADTGTVYAFGVNTWNSPYPIAYRSTAGAASQTGSNLVVDGATASVSNWLRAGDIIDIAGVNGAREVTADTASVANGHVQIPINPPIFTGGSPADNAAVTITGVTLTACILEPPTLPSTSGTSSDYGEVSCRFSEVL